MSRNPLFALVLFFGSAGVTEAALIDVNFVGGISPGVTGSAAIGSPGDTWNALFADNPTGGSTATNLVTTAGSLTDISATITADGVTDPSGPAWNQQSPNHALTQYYVFAGAGSSVNVALSGLAPDDPYDLFVYTTSDPRALASRYGTVVAAVANGGASEAFTGDGTLTSWIDGGNYVMIPVNADQNGNLSFSALTGNMEIDINGFQLASTPEPAAWIMAVIGLIGLFAVARGRRKRASAMIQPN
jgi:MYXO-CTERM domain-containing protein